MFTLGIVEGFYGVFYTFPERDDLIRFAGPLGYRYYLYAPKNDRQHRACWREPYPDRVMDQFAETIRIAREAQVTFCYAISPGGSICYGANEDFANLTAKLTAFFRLGVRDFCLMLDDNEPGFYHTSDQNAFSNLPAAQAFLANRIFGWLKELDPACTLSLVPAEYSGRAPFSPSLVELARALHPKIDLYYTGPAICSPTLTAGDALQFHQATGRKPLIWDNYPVNDLSMQPELHLGPLTGRSADLLTAVKGILVNPMLQAEASKIPLMTVAEYCANPVGYDPCHAWEKALETVAGQAYTSPLRILVENTNRSCLIQQQDLELAGQKLDRLAKAARTALQNGCPLASPAFTNLEAYLAEIDEAGYTLKFRLENLALRNNLLPWIELLEHWMWMTRFVFKTLRAIECGQLYQPALQRVFEYREMIRLHPKRINNQSLLTFVDEMLQRVEKFVHIYDEIPENVTHLWSQTDG